MIKSFTANPFSLTLNTTELLGAFVSRIRDIKDGTIARYPGIAARFSDLVAELGSDEISDLRTLATERYQSSLCIARAESVEAFVGQLTKLLETVVRNNETAVDIANPKVKFVRRPSIKDNEHPDLMYRLLLQPGARRTYSRLDEHCLLLTRELRQKTTRFTAELARVKTDSPEDVLSEVRDSLNEAVDTPMLRAIDAWVNNSSDCSGGRTHLRTVAMLDRLRIQSERTQLVDWYPNWFDMIATLPEAPTLFGPHRRELNDEFLRVQAALLALGQLDVVKLPGFASEALTEYLHQINETMIALTAMVEMRSLFINGYHDIVEFTKG
ncbi:hypothetical protein pEaSNUABM54_00314 [Erwinia phage pEa_SNUABM_54]|nr:hypothetical protein pEaSNUABM54_00314 [Erwinia phage pEa_SNUABM_54]